eukprot:SAG11_NODE_185_length_13160_cov_9.118521_8_plen_171_part_00
MPNVIRGEGHPRLPRMFWGEFVYATPGSGKTCVARKYRDVVDADELLVEAIQELAPRFDPGSYDDPRAVIYRYFNYIRFNRWKMDRCYDRMSEKVEHHKQLQDVVLFGTMDLLHCADRVFIEKNSNIVREGFAHKQYVEESRVEEVGCPVHCIYEYLDNSLQQTARAAAA